SQYFHHSNFAIHFHENFTADKKLDSLTGLNLFRICQEIINNSFKHAEAKNIFINIICSKKEIIISIQDNGKGFDVNNNSSKGYGLQNMQNRAKEHGFVISCNSIIGKGIGYNIHLMNDAFI
ncbi:MAG: hypothetical protein KF781_03325, partial [Chitinophagaceae bacterium]|nr:hypothetical protein [Chitinophagaceae bacterium]